MRVSLQWDYPDPFVHPIVATGEDIDSYGHVNNRVYVGWLEDCAWAHSSALGYPEAKCLEMARGMAVRTLHIDYIGACFEGDHVDVGNWIIGNDGRLRARRRFQLLNRTRQQVVMRGEVEYFCLNLETGKPVRMPVEFVQAYKKTLELSD